MTNIELANIALQIYNGLQTVYAKGGIGWLLTRDRMDSLCKQYEWNETHLTKYDLGKHACDCSGMIVGMAYDGWRVDHEPTWTKAHDWNDAMLGERLTDCVSPDKAEPGMCLWKKGHVGLAVFGGMALDSNAEASGSGIHYRKISDVNWEKAGKLPEIEYLTIKVGDIIPMKVTSITDGTASGSAWVGVPTPSPTPVPGITVGSKVTINPGARAGGLNKKYRGLLIDPKCANGKYVDTVKKIETHYGVEEALLIGINTWVAVKDLKLVQ